MVVQVDPFYLELVPKDPSRRPALPIVYIARDILDGLMDGAYAMLASPPKFKLITEELIINLPDPQNTPKVDSD